MKIAIGSDHGGFDLKELIIADLRKREIEVEDVGCFDKQSVDYPDFVGQVGRRVSEKLVERGIVVCTTGIGASITANKYPGVRAALCTSEHLAEMSRRHNNSNVLALGSQNTTEEEALAILDVWLRTDFDGGRHQRRVDKIEGAGSFLANLSKLEKGDPGIAELLWRELRLCESSINLFASENLMSPAVRAAAGSILGDKYASGYPGGRHYPGCAFADEVERIAGDRCKALFGAEHANLQPYSGSSANMAVFMAALNPGDAILAMSPDTGGHITHGGAGNISGMLYKVFNYSLDLESGLLDYEQIAALAEEHRPRLICIGDSLYPRFIDFKRLRAIADATGAYLMADIAHSAGLVAAGCYPNPTPYCEFVTLTTHKTMRGPRGGVVLCQERFAERVDRQLYPGSQGGPHMNLVAAKAVCMHEASQPQFKQYQQQVVVNSKALAQAIEDMGLPVLSGGTDIHMCAADISKCCDGGHDIEQALERAGILLNLFPVRVPGASGAEDSAPPLPMIRVGTPWLTTRGLGEDDMATVAQFLQQALNHSGSRRQLSEIRTQVAEFMRKYPIE